LEHEKLRSKSRRPVVPQSTSAGDVRRARAPRHHRPVPAHAELSSHARVLLELMRERRVNQQEVAEGAGVDKNTLSALIHQGRDTKVGTLNKLAKYFQVPPARFLETSLEGSFKAATKVEGHDEVDLKARLEALSAQELHEEQFTTLVWQVLGQFIPKYCQGTALDVLRRVMYSRGRERIQMGYITRGLARPDEVLEPEDVPLHGR
jgi:transcriptional regulator with XRE-family HTH domain